VSLLTDRVALVTGASRGIGQAVATALEGEGARVVRVARSVVPAASGSRLDIPCDVSDPAQVEALAEKVGAHFGAPDVVVNGAGVFLLATVEGTLPEQFDRQLAANLRAPFLVARAFLPGMRARGHGRMITIGSIADHRSFPGNTAYAASKFGVRGLHEALREEYRGTGVLCSLVSPGPTDTSVWDAVNPDQRPGFTPRSRMLRVEDVADAVVWVAGRPDQVDVDWIRLGPS
jgi:NAD(P)-dependent dehydrogenase (short-subunit alcohol dehydrogenase family)